MNSMDLTKTQSCVVGVRAPAGYRLVLFAAVLQLRKISLNPGSYVRIGRVWPDCRPNPFLKQATERDANPGGSMLLGYFPL